MDVCVICGTEIDGFGNNPAPVKASYSGRCCDLCNAIHVIPARFDAILDKQQEDK